MACSRLHHHKSKQLADRQPGHSTRALAVLCRHARRSVGHQSCWRVKVRAEASAPGAGDDSSRARVFAQQHGDITSTIQFPCTVPLLPFHVEEVLLPGSVKTLHLFEARYLSLLDSVLEQPGSNKVFGHVVIEEQGDVFGGTAAAFPGAFRGEQYVFLMATLVRVVEVKKTFVGALVRIQAEARVEVQGLQQTWPFFTGQVVPLCDTPPQDVQQVLQQAEQLAQTVRDLQNLTQRFRSRQSASLQQAMYWADRDALVPAAAAAALPPLPGLKQQQDTISTSDSNKSSSSSGSSEVQCGCQGTAVDGFAAAGSSEGEGSADGSSLTANSSDVSSADALEGSSRAAEQHASSQQQQQQQQLGPELHGSRASPVASQYSLERAARLSFAALQGVPQESVKDQLKLLRCCVKAMQTQDTATRLMLVQQHMQHSLNTLAAKCALKSLNL